MKEVFALFFTIAAVVLGWTLLSSPEKRDIQKLGRKLVIPVVVAAIVTIAVLFFALTTNGRML